MDGITGTILKLFFDGGWMMYPLLLTSLVGLIFIIERWFALRTAKTNVNEFLAKIRKALIQQRSVKQATKICEDYSGPVSSIMKAGLLKFGHPKDEVEKTIENAAIFEIGRFEKNMVWLATVANVAPLMGFLGTVAGMINSFEALAEAGLSNPGLVASGISEALITTASGLAIAIPVQLAYNFFMNKINKFVRDVETSTNMLLEAFGEMERGGISPDAGGQP